MGRFTLLFCSYPDEFESTRIIGERQFRKAVDLFNKASEPLQGKVDYRHIYLDFSKLEVTLSNQSGASEVVKTCPAAMGFAFAAGTTDGPGAFDFKQGDDQVIVNWNYLKLKTLPCVLPKTRLRFYIVIGFCFVISGKSLLEVGTRPT